MCTLIREWNTAYVSSGERATEESVQDIKQETQNSQENKRISLSRIRWI